MKIEQVRKIKSIESESLKLSKNDRVYLTDVSHNYVSKIFSNDLESLIVGMRLFDSDLGEVDVCVKAMTPVQVKNLEVVLKMLQGSV